MDLREKLKDRLGLVSGDMLDVMVHVVELYGAEVNIKNLITGDLILFDDRNRRVCFKPTEMIANQTLHLNSKVKHDCEIIICVSGGSILGWIRAEDVTEDQLAPLSALSPLPEDFDFKIQCSHLSTHGGYTMDYKHWVCSGCGKELVFSDKKR